MLSPTTFRGGILNVSRTMPVNEKKVLALGVLGLLLFFLLEEVGFLASLVDGVEIDTLPFCTCSFRSSTTLSSLSVPSSEEEESSLSSVAILILLLLLLLLLLMLLLLLSDNEDDDDSKKLLVDRSTELGRSLDDKGRGIFDVTAMSSEEEDTSRVLKSVLVEGFVMEARGMEEEVWIHAVDDRREPEVISDWLECDLASVLNCRIFATKFEEEEEEEEGGVMDEEVWIHVE